MKSSGTRQFRSDAQRGGASSGPKNPFRNRESEAAQNEGSEVMASYNRVVLMGNLTRDVDLRRTSGGTPVADLGLAVNERFRNKEGEQVESTCFVDIVVWQRLAEVCGEYLHKGSPVMVEGRLQLDQWKTDAGEKRSRLRVRAERVAFLPAGKRESSDEREPEAAYHR